MVNKLYNHITGTIAAIGIILAIVFAILFFMNLPIFDVRMVSWFFVYGLCSAAVGLGAFIVRAIWSADY